MSVPGADPGDGDFSVGKLELPRKVRNDPDTGGSGQIADFGCQSGRAVSVLLRGGEFSFGIDRARATDREDNFIGLAGLQILALAVVKSNVVQLTLALWPAFQQRFDWYDLHVCRNHVEANSGLGGGFRLRVGCRLRILFTDAVHAGTGCDVKPTV